MKYIKRLVVGKSCMLMLVTILLVFGIRSSLLNASVQTLDTKQNLSTEFVTLNFKINYTANLFYIVDQISRWDYFTHYYYREYWDKEYGFSDKDKEYLEKYINIRRKYPWGELEPIFFSIENVEQAWEKAFEVMTRKEVKTLREIIIHFKPKFDRLWKKAEYLYKTRQELIGSMTPEMLQMLDKVARFFSSPKLNIDVMMIYNPEERGGGGGFNGGRIALEVSRKGALWRTIHILSHELYHAFIQGAEKNLEPQRNLLTELSRKSRLKLDVFVEGIVHALSPGIFDIQFLGTNTLAEQVREQEQYNIDPTDEIYLMKKLGSALIPLTQDYLDKGIPLSNAYILDGIKVYQNLESDPYISRFEETKADFGEVGIGIGVDFDNRTLIVISFAENSPAKMVGMRVDDEIIEIDGKPIDQWLADGMSLMELLRTKLRGKVSTTVYITVQRNKVETIRFTIPYEIMKKDISDKEKITEPAIVIIGKKEAYQLIKSKVSAYVQGLSPNFIPENLKLIEKKMLIIAFDFKKISLPQEYRYLIPYDYDKMIDRLKKGENFKVRKVMDDRLVILFAAQNEKKLLKMIEEYDFGFDAIYVN